MRAAGLERPIFILFLSFRKMKENFGTQGAKHCSPDKSYLEKACSGSLPIHVVVGLSSGGECYRVVSGYCQGGRPLGHEVNG